jgi:hypothetical protein
MSTTETETETEAPQEALDEGKDLGAGGKRALQAERDARKSAEQQLATLGQRVEALQRLEVERIAGSEADGFRPLASAADLWRADGVEIGALLTEDGDVDASKVRETVGGVLESRPHWGAAPPRPGGSVDAGRGQAAAAPTMAQLADQVMRP